MMEKDAKIFVAGSSGMVGSAIVRKLKQDNYKNILVTRSSEVDLRNQVAVEDFFEEHRPDYVFLAAAKVGGIMANNVYRGQFLYENLMIESNVIHNSYLHKVKKLLFLGSSCIYPKLAEQPLKESALLTGSLEHTNEPYAIAKITGLKLCENYRLQYGCDFISVMPPNLYGSNDNYDLNNSHVLPALLKKIYEAKLDGNKEVVVWGTGKPLREFMHVDDLADACVYLMDNYSELGFINAGTGEEISIRELAMLIRDITGFKGEFIFDSSKPDGTPRKVLDNTRIHKMGWRAKISLAKGIQEIFEKDFKPRYQQNTAAVQR